MTRSPVARRSWAILALSVLLLCLVMARVEALDEDPGAPMDGVVAMDSASFEELVGKDRGALVEFYAPWCGHCKTMAPEYRALGEMYLKTPAAQQRLVIGKVDATKNRELASAHGVTGFPAILYFPPQSTKGEKYTDSRTKEGMVRFLNKKIPDVGLFVPKEVQFALELTAETFDTVVMDSTKDVMVLMYAPWCGHCKQLKPIYNKLAKVFENEDDVVIAMFDADAKHHREIGGRYAMTGYPTVLYFGKFNKGAPLEYTGERDLQELVVYINDRAGTQRLLDGDLSWEYGVEEALSKAVAAIAKSPEAKRVEAAKKAIQAIGEQAHAIGADYYAKVAERVSKDVQYLSTEKARLERMLEGAVGGKKRDSVILRFNILSSIEQQL